MADEDILIRLKVEKDLSEAENFIQQIKERIQSISGEDIKLGDVDIDISGITKSIKKAVNSALKNISVGQINVKKLNLPDEVQEIQAKIKAQKIKDVEAGKGEIDVQVSAEKAQAVINDIKKKLGELKAKPQVDLSEFKVLYAAIGKVETRLKSLKASPQVDVSELKNIESIARRIEKSLDNLRATVKVDAINLGKLPQRITLQADIDIKQALQKLSGIRVDFPLGIKWIWKDALKRLQSYASRAFVDLKVRFNLDDALKQLKEDFKTSVKISRFLYGEAMKKLRKATREAKGAPVKISRFLYGDALKKLRETLKKKTLSIKAEIKASEEGKIDVGKWQTAQKAVQETKEAVQKASGEYGEAEQKFKELEEAIDKSSRSLREAKKQAKGVGDAYKGAGSSTETLRKKLEQTVAKLREHIARYREGEKRARGWAQSQLHAAESVSKLIAEKRGLSDFNQVLKEVAGQDLSGLRGELEQAQESFAQNYREQQLASREAKTFGGVLQNLSGDARDLTGKMIRQAKAIQALIPEYARGKAKAADLIGEKGRLIAQYEKELQRTGKLEQAQREFQRVLGHTSQEYKDVASSARQYTEQIGYKQETALSRTGQVAKNAFRRVAVWGTATAIFYGVFRAMRRVVEVTKEVESGIVELQKVMNTATTDFQAMGRAAYQMAQDLGQSITDVLDVMSIFGRQGMKASEVIDMTRTSLMAANVTLMDASEAAENLTAAVRQFNLSFETSENILDTWNNVANKNAVTAKQLASSIKLGGVAAKTAGLTFEQYTATTSALAEATRQAGSTLGRSLRMIFTRMYRPKSLQMLEQFNIQIREGQDSYRSAWDILNDLASIWDKLGRAQQISIATAMVGRRRYNDLVVLLQNWDRVLKALSDAQGAAGSAMLENVKYMQTYEKQLARLQASVQKLLTSIGKAGFVDALRGVTQGLRRLVPTLAGKIEDYGAIPLATVGSALAGIFTVAFGGTAVRKMKGVMSDLYPELEGSTRKIFGKVAINAAAFAGGAAASMFVEKFASDLEKQGKEIESTIARVASVAAGAAMAFFAPGPFKFAGIAMALQGIMPLLREVGELFKSQTEKLKLQLSHMFDEIDALKQIASLTEEVAVLQDKVNAGEATSVDLLLKQRKLLEQIVSQYPEMIAGVKDYGLVLGEMQKISWSRAVEEAPQVVWEAVKKTAKEVGGIELSPQFDPTSTEELKEFLAQHQKLEKVAKKKWTFRGTIGPTDILGDFLQKRYTDLLRDRFDMIEELLEKATSRIDEHRRKYLQELGRLAPQVQAAIAAGNEAEAKRLKDQESDLVSGIMEMEEVARREVDRATSLLRSSVGAGMENVEEVMEKHAGIISRFSDKYAWAFDLTSTEKTLTEKILGLRRTITKLFGLTEDQIKKANIDEVLIDYFKDNADAIDEGGRITGKAITELGSIIEDRLREARLVQKESLDALAVDWKSFSDYIERIIQLPLASLGRFVKGLSSKMSRIQQVLEVKPTVGLVDAWESTLDEIRRRVDAFNMGILATLNAEDFFRKNRGQISEELKKWVGEEFEYGAEALQKSLSIAPGIDLSGVSDEVLRLFDQIRKAKLPSLQLVEDTLFKLQQLDLSGPQKAFVSINARVLALTKYVNYAMKEMKRLGVTGVDVADVLKSAGDEADTISQELAEMGVNQDTVLKAIEAARDIYKEIQGEIENIFDAQLLTLKAEQQRKDLVQSMLDLIMKSGDASRQAFAALFKQARKAYGSVEEFVRQMAAGFPSPFEAWRRDVLGAKRSQDDMMSSIEQMLYTMDKTIGPSKGLNDLKKQYIELRNSIKDAKEEQQEYTDYLLMSAKEQAKASVAYTYLTGVQTRRGLLAMTDEMKETINRVPLLKNLFEKKVTKLFPELKVETTGAENKLRNILSQAVKLLTTNAREILNNIKELPQTQQKMLTPLLNQLTNTGKVYEEASKTEKEASEKQKSAAEKFELLDDATVNLKIASDNFVIASENAKSVSEILQETLWEVKARPTEEISVEKGRTSPVAPEAPEPAWKGMPSVKVDISDEMKKLSSAATNTVTNVRKQVENYNQTTDFRALVFDKMNELLRAITFPFNMLEGIKDFFDKLRGKRPEANTESLTAPSSVPSEWTPPSDFWDNARAKLLPPYDFWKPVQDRLAQNAQIAIPQQQEPKAELHFTFQFGDVHAESPEEVKTAMREEGENIVQKVEETMNAIYYGGGYNV